MPRIYVQLQVDFDDDPDVARILRYRRPREARAVRELLTSMWRYCKREKSDGHIPLEVVGKLAYPDSEKVAIEDADKLVDCGLAERTETGYYLPGYLKHNKSRAQIEEESAKKAAAGRLGGMAKQSAKHTAKQVAEPFPSHSSENREQRTETGTTEGGERPVTLPVADATKPPHDPTRCKDHQGVDAPPPCGGCRSAREASERREARSRLAVVADCATCGGTGWIEDADGSPVRKCDHRRNA